jgi:hypothetical protein
MVARSLRSIALIPLDFMLQICNCRGILEIRRIIDIICINNI